MEPETSHVAHQGRAHRCSVIWDVRAWHLHCVGSQAVEERSGMCFCCMACPSSPPRPLAFEIKSLTMGPEGARCILRRSRFKHQDGSVTRPTDSVLSIQLRRVGPGCLLGVDQARGRLFVGGHGDDMASDRSHIKFNSASQSTCRCESLPVLQS